MKSKLYTWIDERYDLSPVLKFMEHKTVPVHKHSMWYYMGGVTLFLFIVQIATGILLVLYYQPGIDTAYESVHFLMTKVQFGWLIRQLHGWAANLMIFFIFIHMFSVFFTRAFRKPRELTWVSGMFLMFIAMGAGFSGYLLPWNELAFFATKVGTDIAGAVPGIGKAVKILLRGGDDVTGATLSRFYAFHVALIPALLSIMLAVHLIFVQRQGMHEPDHFAALPEDKKRTIPFFPNFMLRDALLWLVVLNILAYLALFFPWELGIKADAFASAPIGIRPEWYFMFMFQTLKFIPAHVWFMEGEVLGILGFGVIGLAWLLVPFWEIKDKPGRKFKPMTVIGIIAVIYIIILTILGYVL